MILLYFEYPRPVYCKRFHFGESDNYGLFGKIWSFGHTVRILFRGSVKQGVFKLVFSYVKVLPGAYLPDMFQPLMRPFK